MGLFSKLFSQKEVIYPEVGEGMSGVFMQGIGMHWASGCKPLVEAALKNVDGVETFIVETPPKDHAYVIFDPKRTNIDSIKKAIIETGYDVQNVELA